MSNRRTITYAIGLDSGYVYSRVGDKVALPIIDYKDMGPENNFALKYHLEAVPVHEIGREWNSLKWTRKIPTDIKNYHRQFWDMPLLPTPDRQTKEEIQ
jgi:hypothetical protein